MLRILREKRLQKRTLRQNLKQIYGINESTIKKICQFLGFQESLEYKILKRHQIYKIFKYIEDNLTIEKNLKKIKVESKKFLEKAKNCRGIRNRNGLPSRGQRTHTNAKTKKKLKNG